MGGVEKSKAVIVKVTKYLQEIGKIYYNNCCKKYGPLAHLVEHRPFKAGVAGSSPARPTIFFCSAKGGKYASNR